MQALFSLFFVRWFLWYLCPLFLAKINWSNVIKSLRCCNCVFVYSTFSDRTPDRRRRRDRITLPDLFPSCYIPRRRSLCVHRTERNGKIKSRFFLISIIQARIWTRSQPGTNWAREGKSFGWSKLFLLNRNLWNWLATEATNNIITIKITHAHVKSRCQMGKISKLKDTRYSCFLFTLQIYGI